MEKQSTGIIWIDHFQAKVFTLKTTKNEVKYPDLEKLIKVCLTLSHGNADIERSFSETKNIVTSKHTLMSNHTLNGYKCVKSYMRRYDSKSEKLLFNQKLCMNVSNARKIYRERIEREQQAMKKCSQQIDKNVNLERELKELKKKRRPIIRRG